MVVEALQLEMTQLYYHATYHTIIPTMLHILLSYPRSLMSFMSLIPIIPLYQAGRMVAEDLELTVETLRCREDREASGLVKKVRLVNFSPNSLI